jgi:5-methylcytosine-specific restriction endonuclease McrA
VSVKIEQSLWCEVLSLAISDALTGTSSTKKSHLTRIHEIERNRQYLTVQNRDFDMVCSLAGVDAVATREHLTKRIAQAATPQELVSGLKSSEQRRTTRSIARPSIMRAIVPKFAHFDPACTHSGCTNPAIVVGHSATHKRYMKILWEKANWQSVCGPCHNRHKQRLEAIKC